MNNCDTQANTNKSFIINRDINFEEICKVKSVDEIKYIAAKIKDSKYLNIYIFRKDDHSIVGVLEDVRLKYGKIAIEESITRMKCCDGSFHTKPIVEELDNEIGTVSLENYDKNSLAEKYKMFTEIEKWFYYKKEGFEKLFDNCILTGDVLRDNKINSHEIIFSLNVSDNNIIF